MLQLKILIFVWTLRLVVLHTDFSMAKDLLALLILVLNSWSVAGHCHLGAQIGEFFNVF